MKIKVENWKGILFCFAISVPAWFIGNKFPVIGGPVLGILLGMIMSLLIKEKKRLKPGVLFTSKKLLQLAVILLGFGMNLSDVFASGRKSLPIIVCTITASLLVAFFLQKLLKIPSNIATLIGVGSSICGGSAIAATAPVIQADDEEVAQSISVIFLFNIIAAIIFPAFGSILGMTHEEFAVFAGTAINDTSSVTAAASAWDTMYGANTLEMATIVKLTRTLAIIPITLCLSVIKAQKEKRSAQHTHANIKIYQLFPVFILFFLLASVITTVFHLSHEIILPLKAVSKFLIIMAMTAIGFNTDIVKLIKTGSKPIIMGFSCWIVIMFTSLVMQFSL